MSDSIFARRARARRRTILVQAPVQRHVVESETAGYRAKAQPGTEGYKAMVAEPMMKAIDSMPKEWRMLVHAFDYVDVYRAWRRGIPQASVVRIAHQMGGRFQL